MYNREPERLLVTNELTVVTGIASTVVGIEE